MGDKQSSNAITEEYAKADPIYVAKTMVRAHEEACILVLTQKQALPAMYSHYRPILGDGNCGWRGR